MINLSKPLMLLVACLVTGCVSQTQFLDSKQSMAIQTALRRGQFELNCPEATPTVISREVSACLAGALRGRNPAGGIYDWRIRLR